MLSDCGAAGINQAMNYVIAGLIGLASGTASGLFGVGGGLVMVPAMMFFMTMGIKQSIGTSLAVIIPTAMVGAFQHHRADHVDWHVAAMLAPTAILGGFVGSWLTTQIHADNLKKTFGAFLVLVGVRLLLFR
jgi:uncharacterized protein